MESFDLVDHVTALCLVGGFGMVHASVLDALQKASAQRALLFV